MCKILVFFTTYFRPALNLGNRYFNDYSSVARTCMLSTTPDKFIHSMHGEVKHFYNCNAWGGEELAQPAKVLLEGTRGNCLHAIGLYLIKCSLKCSSKNCYVPHTCFFLVATKTS